MPKQGQFARVARASHHRTLKGRVHRQQRTIADGQGPDFLVARFALTAKRHLPQELQESAQRCLQELAQPLLATGDGQAALTALLQTAQGRVPWQFWAQVSLAWPVLAAFLRREVPVVPLKQRVGLAKLPSAAEVDQLIAAQLSRQAAALTLLQAQQTEQTEALARQLQQQFWRAEHLNWAAVQALLGPFPFVAAPAADAGTAAWLRQVAAFDPVAFSSHK